MLFASSSGSMVVTSSGDVASGVRLPKPVTVRAVIGGEIHRIAYGVDNWARDVEARHQLRACTGAIGFEEGWAENYQYFHTT